MPVKWGFGGRGPVAIVTDGVNNSAKQFLSVSVITGGTNKNVSNNVKNFPFWRYHTTLRKEQSSWRKEDLIRLETQAVEERKLYFTSSELWNQWITLCLYWKDNQETGCI